MIDRAANGTINFPHVEMTLALTDEMKNCNPKPLQKMAEGNQTLLPQQTTTVNAVIITTNANDVTDTIQPLPQFGETTQSSSHQRWQQSTTKYSTSE